MPGPRTPLLHPRAYFEAHDGAPPLAHAALAVGVVTLATGGAVLGFLVAFAGALDVTVTVDNPAHTPEWVCDGYPVGNVEAPEGCDPSVPETVERRLGALVYAELSWLPWVALLAVPAMWVFQAAVLHAGTALADGRGPFADTLAVAGWGMVPSLARTLSILSVLVYQLRSTSLPGDPDGALAALRAAFAWLGPVGFLAAVVVAVWAGAIRVCGLAAARDVSTGDAFWVVLATTVVGLLLEGV